MARCREVGAVSGSRKPLGVKPVAAHSNSNSDSKAIRKHYNLLSTNASTKHQAARIKKLVRVSIGPKNI